MQLTDFAAVLFWLFIIYSLAIIIKELRYPNDSDTFKKYFLPGLTVKLLGAFAFDAIYMYYYGGGDTLAYYQFSQGLYEAFFFRPMAAFQVLLSNAGQSNYYIDDITRSMQHFFLESGTFMVVKICAIFNLLTYNSFWATSLLFAFVAYLGLWAMYRVFIQVCPNMEKSMAFAVLFMPSVAFWGSGIMKDSISMACLGGLLYGLYYLCLERKKIALSLLLIPVCFHFVYDIKPYIIMAFMPAFAYWVVLYYKQKVTDLPLKVATFLVMLLIGGVLFYQTRYMLADVGNNLFAKFVSMAMGFQGWHGMLAEQGSSGYSFGTIEFTIPGILSKFPQSVNVTLFRPYLYEVRNPVMLITAIESAIILLITLYLLVKTRIIGIFTVLNKYPFALFCLIFTLLFGFAVGFTSYNFGALARYKIPCLPFYGAFLAIIWNETKLNKSK